jgi:class 3 adenylate cyclase
MSPEGTKRKLTAILSADVKEYSRLMSQDEMGTIRILGAYKAAMGKLIEDYRGHVVDSPGDNLLAEFDSVVDAVNCAGQGSRGLCRLVLPGRRHFKSPREPEQSHRDLHRMRRRRLGQTNQREAGTVVISPRIS